jgi:WD40 repeat protein
VVSGGVDRKVRVWDLGGGPARVLEGHTGRVTAVAFLGDHVVSAGDDQTVRLWLPSGQARVVRGSAPVRRLAVSADGTQLAVGYDDGILRVLGAAAPPAHVPGALTSATIGDDGVLTSHWVD